MPEQFRCNRCGLFYIAAKIHHLDTIESGTCKACHFEQEVARLTEELRVARQEVDNERVARVEDRQKKQGEVARLTAKLEGGDARIDDQAEEITNLMAERSRLRDALHALLPCTDLVLLIDALGVTELSGVLELGGEDALDWVLRKLEAAGR